MSKEYLRKCKTKFLEALALFTYIYFMLMGGHKADSVLPLVIGNVQEGVARQLFGLSLAYLMHLALNPSCGDLSYFRPCKWFKEVLSAKLWLPIATLSYSFYLIHIMVIAPFNLIPFFSPYAEYELDIS